MPSDEHPPYPPSRRVPGSNRTLGLAFTGDPGSESVHREALRAACTLASQRERSYDQPWWAANLSALLDYTEACEAALERPENREYRALFEEATGTIP